MAGDGAEGSKALVLKLYGDKLGPQLAFAAGYGRGYDWRKVIEPTDATAQCENSGRPFVAGMPCYMCGLPIPAKTTPPKPSDELWPECEHVLPLTEGRWLLDVYIANRVMGDDWSKKARNLEYDQAHRVCNQAKGILSYIVDNDDGTTSVSRPAIVAILKKVVERAQTNIGTKGDRRQTMSAIASMNIEARADAIYARVKECVDHINTAPFQQVGAPGLVVLVRASLLVDPNTLVPAAREVHTRWYKEKEGLDQHYRDALALFVSEFRSQYPVLSTPETIAEHLTRLLPRGDYSDIERGYLLSTTPPIEGLLKQIYDRKDRNEADVDISGAHVLNLIMYGLFMTLAKQLGPEAESRKDVERLYCDILRRMSQIANLPSALDARGKPLSYHRPLPADVFGPPPPEPRACAKHHGAEARQVRILRAENNELESDTIVIQSITDQGLATALKAIYPRFFGRDPRPDEIAESISYAERALTTFLQSYPERYYDAQLVAARAFTERPAVALTLLSTNINQKDLTQALFDELKIYAPTPRGGRRKTRRRRKMRKTLRKRVRA